MSGTGQSASLNGMSGSGHITRPARFRFVAIVASLGGLPVVRSVLEALPATFDVPVLVVQHRAGTTRPDALARLLGRQTALPVRSGCPGTPAWEPGVIVIPGRSAATISRNGQIMLRPATLREPGGDALLCSAARAAAPGAGIAVILSGRLDDGARGARSVKTYGGRVLAQDPATALAPSMPSSAIATGCIDFVLPPQRIAPALIALTMAPGGADLLTVPTPHWAALGPG